MDATPPMLDQLVGLTGLARQRAVQSFTAVGVGSNLPTHLTRTFQIASPRQTHTRPADCATAGCDAHRDGFQVVCANDTTGRATAARIEAACRPAGARLAPAVAARIRRRYTLTVDPAGSRTYRFPAGTPCFTEHRVPLERPELFVVRDGDVRGNPRRTEPRIHTRGELWVEECQEHLDQLDRARN